MQHTKQDSVLDTVDRLGEAVLATLLGVVLTITCLVQYANGAYDSSNRNFRDDLDFSLMGVTLGVKHAFTPQF